MDGMVFLLVVTGILLVLAILSVGYGVDSRDGIGDDRARPIWS
jgi:hypothetical protein